MKELQIVIGENDPTCAADLARLVKKLGHRVVASVSSGNEVAINITRLTPDLVLINAGLAGDIEGVSAAEQIHALTGIPVVAVIRSEKKTLVPSTDNGECYEILVTPFDEPALSRAIQSALNKSSLNRQMDDAKEELSQYRAHIDAIVAERTLELEQENARQKKLLHDIELTERKLATGTLVPGLSDEGHEGCMTGTGVITVDNDLHIILMNECARQVLGVKGDTATGTVLTDVFSCPDPEKVEHIHQSLQSIIAARSPGEKIGSVPVKTSSGALISCAVSLELIINPDKKRAGVLVTFRDRARTSAQGSEQVISSENIEAYTMLVRGVAHDFNNMLSSILANIQLAKMETFADSRTFNWLNSAENGVTHARELSQQLLTLTAGKNLSDEIQAPPKPASPVMATHDLHNPPAGRKKMTAVRKKILLMDDEEAILSATSEMLKFLDYTVEVVQTGDIAIEMYRKAQDDGVPFDAVILDITVPDGMGAKEALPLLKQIDPDVRAIISSGYSTNPMIVDYRAFGFTAAIVKPYGFRELDAALSDAFEPE